MLLVQVPSSYHRERSYIISVLLDSFLGLDYKVEFAERYDMRITGGDSKELIIADKFFAVRGSHYLKSGSLPRQPLKLWRANPAAVSNAFAQDSIPVIYGEDPSLPGFVEISENRIRIGLDIFGSAFFMLTRYEEVARAEYDQYGRFPAKSSLAYQEGFLERPIIDEYLELLWLMIKTLWPGLQRKHREFEVRATHDVDHPFLYKNISPVLWARMIAGDLVKRMNPAAAWRHLINGGLSFAGLTHNDPADRFDWLMDESEKAGIKSQFFFMACRRSGEGYSLIDRKIYKTVCRIAGRRHEIGIHPNIGSYNNPNLLRSEIELLRNFLSAVGIETKILGGRQHYLSWQAPVTWQIWDDLGLAFDSSAGYAEHIGFRAGTCQDYPVFNILKREKLNLVERPLHIMDCTLFSEKYMNLKREDAFERCKEIKETVRKYRGKLNLLWHNSWFYTSSKEDEFYRSLLNC